MHKVIIVILTIFIGSSLPAIVWANDIDDKACFACHKIIKSSYLRSTHGRLFFYFSNKPQERRGCETCHGAGEKHMAVAGESESPDSLYIEGFNAPPEQRAKMNQICIQCHEDSPLLHWNGSLHQIDDVACTDCHKLHSESNKVTSEVCGSCHVEQRVKVERSSHRSQLNGGASCLDCHAPHGGSSTGSLKRSSISETCFSCHADLRGPFLWEHAPVREDCGNCHDPHGSNNDAMLSMRAPYLCQSCHQMAFHSSSMFDGSGVTAGSRSPFVVGGSCVNCHILIHGSNHPSGARFQR